MPAAVSITSISRSMAVKRLAPRGEPFQCGLGLRDVRRGTDALKAGHRKYCRQKTTAKGWLFEHISSQLLCWLAVSHMFFRTVFSIQDAVEKHKSFFRKFAKNGTNRTLNLDVQVVKVGQLGTSFLG